MALFNANRARLPNVDRVTIVGVGAVALSKAADLLTTIYGLSAYPHAVRETNAVAVAVIDAAGLVTGLTLLSLVSVFLGLLIVEAGRRYIGYGWKACAIYYGMLTVAWVAAAVNNALLLATV